MEYNKIISTFNTLIQKNQLSTEDKQALTDIFNQLLQDNKKLRTDNEELKDTISTIMPKRPHIEITRCF